MRKPNNEVALTISDKTRLNVLFMADFNRQVAYKELHPDLFEYSNQSVSAYFIRTLKKDAAQEYMQQLVKEKYKNSFVSKEKLILELLDQLTMAKKLQRPRDSAYIISQISKMLGYEISKTQMEVTVNQPIQINYVIPNDMLTIETKMKEIE